MAKAITVNRKTRGRPKVGSKLIGVRIEPEMLQQLDKIANEAGVTRPKMLRSAFAEWMESYEANSSTATRLDRPVMLHLKPRVAEALDEASGQTDRSEIINRLVVTWLVKGGFLSAEKHKHEVLPDLD